MESIEKHIEIDKEQLSDPNLSPQRRRHIQSELEDLQKYQKNHPTDHHDPTSLELYCNANPEALECRVYDD